MTKRLFYILLISLCSVIDGFAQTEKTVEQDIIEELSYEDDNSAVAMGVEDEDEIPEGMTLEIDSLLNNFNVQQYVYEDSTCISGVNPAYTNEEFQDRLRRMPTAIEMPWNSVVQSYIDRYAQKLRHHVSLMLGTQNLYMSIFEEALETYGLPLELKYLPVIESSLNPNATSRAGAGGLWQFMVASGKRYGLRINSMIDERRDATKSSYAAAHYLSDLYQIFGDWNLVIAAYNAGPGNIQKAIQRAGGEKDYWKIYPYLPTETRGYVPAFIAANYIMTYYCDHNICPMVTSLPAQTDTVMIFNNLHLRQVSEVLGISIQELRTLNPQYRRDVITGLTEPTDLRLPTPYIKKFIELEDSIWAYDVSGLMKRDVVEVNQGGGSISSVSRKYTRSNKQLTRKKAVAATSRKSSSKKSSSKKRKKR